MKTNKLDQFYTIPLISDNLVSVVKSLLPSFFSNSTKFIEPSAGTGNFLISLMKQGINSENLIAYDIEPKHLLCKNGDYLKNTIKFDDNNFVDKLSAQHRGTLLFSKNLQILM